MKKYIFAIASLLFSMSGFAQDALTIESAAIKAGETGQLKVIVTNPQTSYIACQFDVTLPAGLDVQRTSAGKVSKNKTLELTNRTNNEEEEIEFASTFTEIAANHYRIVLYNDANAPFFGTSGDPILLLNVTATDGFAGGNGKVTAIEMTTGERKVYKAADADFTVSATTAIESVKAGADVNAPAYNLAGQKVNKNYKGVVIQNGKKIAVK